MARCGDWERTITVAHIAHETIYGKANVRLRFVCLLEQCCTHFTFPWSVVVLFKGNCTACVNTTWLYARWHGTSRTSQDDLTWASSPCVASWIFVCDPLFFFLFLLFGGFVQHFGWGKKKKGWKYAFLTVPRSQKIVNDSAMSHMWKTCFQCRNSCNLTCYVCARNNILYVCVCTLGLC